MPERKKKRRRQKFFRRLGWRWRFLEFEQKL
jgi:hypothetical protein